MIDLSLFRTIVVMTTASVKEWIERPAKTTHAALWLAGFIVCQRWSLSVQLVQSLGFSQPPTPFHPFTFSSKSIPLKQRHTLENTFQTRSPQQLGEVIQGGGARATNVVCRANFAPWILAVVPPQKYQRCSGFFSGAVQFFGFSSVPCVVISVCRWEAPKGPSGRAPKTSQWHAILHMHFYTCLGAQSMDWPSDVGDFVGCGDHGAPGARRRQCAQCFLLVSPVAFKAKNNPRRLHTVHI